MMNKTNWYDVQVVIETMNAKGKIKKNREHHLVWGTNYNDVEQKVKKEMEGSIDPWSIKSVKESDIIDIYGKD